MRSLAVTAALALTIGLLVAGRVAAQSPPSASARISGVVETVSEDTLVLKSPESGNVTVVVPADTRVTALENRRLSDIKPGDFVGSAAIKGTDGKLHAQEVHIFPEALRGTGEGHRDMARPEQSMTNATISTVAAAPQGQMLTLNYKGGKQQIEVGPDARIVAIVAGNRALLIPGATVVVTAVKAPDGTLTARSVQAEKDGVMPLMF